MELLNIMGGVDVFSETYDDICELCRRYSWGITKNNKGILDTVTKSSRSSTRGVTWVELSNLLYEFIIDILGSLAS